MKDPLNQEFLRRERTGAFAFTLGTLQWDTFNTFTFRNPIPKPNKCFGLAWRLGRSVSEYAGVPYNRLLFALRGEHGEKGGRFHFHMLIGGTETRNSVTLAHQCEAAWRRISGNAIAECRPYDRTRAGAEYFCKCLGFGANQYEVSKYALADSVTLSESVVRLVTGGKFR